MSDAPQPADAPDPLEILLEQEWAAAQVAQRHVGEVAGKVIDAWRRERAAGIILRARVAELEAALAELVTGAEGGTSDPSEPLPAPAPQTPKTMLLSNSSAAPEIIVPTEGAEP